MQDSSIVPLTVNNVPFLIERLHKDCGSCQYIRELVKNSLEAVTAAQQQGLVGQGEVCLDYDDYYYSQHKIKKFCIADNGIGMSPRDLEQFINQLSSSGKDQCLDGNYGIGGKISTLPDNPFGVVYQSWQNRKGHSVTAVRTHDGRYGLERRLQNGQLTTVALLDKSYHPSVGPDVRIDKNGTRVILLGRNLVDRTFAPPARSGLSTATWLSSYLNSRFFELPPNIRLRVRETINGTDQYTCITGMKSILDGHATNSGTVQLKNAIARWWIMPAEQHGQPNGHIAVLYQSELYDKPDPRAAAARLQQFGISFGHEQVVIYIEPDSDRLWLTTNAARDRMIIDGVDAPWSVWAHEFRQRIPKAIRRLIQRSMPHDDDGGESVRKRLEQVTQFYTIKRFKRSSKGPWCGHGWAMDQLHGYALNHDSPSPDRRKVNPKKKPARSIQLAKSVRLPLVKWISLAGGSRRPEYLSGRAAIYLPELHQIHINEDFCGFRDVVNYWDRQYAAVYGTDSSRKSIIVRVLKTWYEQNLVEAVMGILTLAGSESWTDDQIAKALSEESLTMAAMPKYHLINVSRREIQNLLGRLDSITN